MGKISAYPLTSVVTKSGKCPSIPANSSHKLIWNHHNLFAEFMFVAFSLTLLPIVLALSINMIARINKLPNTFVKAATIFNHQIVFDTFFFFSLWSTQPDTAPTKYIQMRNDTINLFFGSPEWFLCEKPPHPTQCTILYVRFNCTYCRTSDE